MKRKILLIPLFALLAVAFVASPVAACVEKIPVTATQKGAPLTFLEGTGVKKGILRIYAMTGGQVDLGNDLSIDFASSSNLKVIINTKSGKGIIQFDPMTWTNTGGDGTFEGQVYGIIIDYTYAPTGYLPDGTAFPAKFGWAGFVYAVFHGIGVFEGQTLVLHGTRERISAASFTGIMWEGFLLT